MAITTKTNNPTKTKGLETRWFAEINKRYFELKRNIRERLKISQITNAFEMSIEQQRIFMAWLESEIERLLLSGRWQDKYQLESYNRSLRRVRGDLIRAGEDLQLTADERQIIELGEFNFGAQVSLSTSLPTQPVHQDALEFLFNRSFDALRSTTTKMSSTIRTTLFDGVQQGKGIVEITRQLIERVNISQRDAQRIARTETIQAYQRAGVNETQRAIDEFGTEYFQVWITARDERVRHLHANWHGTFATPEETFERINKSPFNCRCGQRTVSKKMLTEKRLNEWQKQRIALLSITG